MPEGPTVRRRKLPGPRVFLKRHVTDYFQGNVWHEFDEVLGDVEFSGSEITHSEGHPFKGRHKRPLQDLGGDFTNVKSKLLSPTTMPFTTIGPTGGPNQGLMYLFTGPIIPAIPGLTSTGFSSSPFPPDLSSTDDQISELGATAISRCKPTKSPADLSTALGELMHDGLPAIVGSALWRDRAIKAKSGAGEYLNVQFGWAPLFSDIKKISKAISKSRDILSQYERDAGRVVRRKYGFPPKKEFTTTVLSTSVFPYGFTGLDPVDRNPYRGSVILNREVQKSQWFSGAFTYYLPTDYNSRNEIFKLADRADVLLGAKLTPETVWNIAPWSWAVDWFSNSGDVLSNLQDFLSHDLVMRYGYMMEKTTIIDTYTHEPDTPLSANRPHVTPLVLVTEIKKRRKANPFGFGLHWDGLSPFQTSIAAALGISRR